MTSSAVQDTTVTTVGALSVEGQRTLAVLRAVAAEVLEHKRRMGHYAVIWENGRILLVGDDAPEPPIQASMLSA